MKVDLSQQEVPCHILQILSYNLTQFIPETGAGPSYLHKPHSSCFQLTEPLYWHVLCQPDTCWRHLQRQCLDWEIVSLSVGRHVVYILGWWWISSSLWVLPTLTGGRECSKTGAWASHREQASSSILPQSQLLSPGFNQAFLFQFLSVKDWARE